MTSIPERYSSRRATLGFDEIPYGVGGVQLYTLDKLSIAQIGYSLDEDGVKLDDTELGTWSADWFVIGNETACGDPIFLSLEEPHPVFTAMQEDDVWTPNLIAPSLDVFWQCLERFQQFAGGRGDPVALEKNPPKDAEIETFLKDMLRLCDGIPETLEFWAIQAEIGMDDERWRHRLEHFLDTGELS